MKPSAMKNNKGMILVLILMFVPIALILVITIFRSITTGSGFAMQSHHKAKAFYLSESGLNIAYRMLQAENFATDTHLPDGTPRSSSDPELLSDITGNMNLTRDSQGWYSWKWNPGDPVADSYTRSGREEEFRFKVTRPTPRTFLIECEGVVGRLIENQKLEGEITPMLNYVIFDNGDLSDFTKSYDYTVTGDIHANGDLFLRPFETDGLEAKGFLLELLGFKDVFKKTRNPKANLRVNSLSAGGQVIRHKDPWGHPDDGGTVSIENVATGQRSVVQGHSQGWSGPGRAFDSLHPTWDAPASNPGGALGRWDGAVVDRTLGGKTKAAPIKESFEPGGYYHTRAALKVDRSSSQPWLKDVTFYNESEGRLIHAKELDVAAMNSAGAWPGNGLIHADAPVRIVNGYELPGPLTIASSSTVYIKGDFNKKFPNAGAKAAGIPQHKPAAIMTTDRVYRLSSSYKDTMSSDHPTVMSMLKDPRFASDAPSYAGDDHNVLEANGAFIDGTPGTDARSWINEPDNPYYIKKNGVTVMGKKYRRKVKQVPAGSSYLKVSYAQAEPLLENLQKVRLEGTGSLGHLRLAEMAKYNNSDASDTVTPWIEHTAYVPPRQTIGGKPGMSFDYDPALVAPGGMSGAPFAPNLGRRMRWSRD